MAKTTTNYGLTKPELNDNITPTIFSDNFDKIDAKLSEALLTGLNGYKLRVMPRTAYNALAVKDTTTLYFVYNG